MCVWAFSVRDPKSVMVERRNLSHQNTCHGNSDRRARCMKRLLCNKGDVEWKILYHPQNRLDSYEFNQCR